MGWLKTIFGEIFGLFVDDGILALSIVVWVVFLRLIAPHLGPAARWGGWLLFSGLALILAGSSWRFSRKRK